MNVESKNTAYAPQERTLFLGPNLQFRVGQGFFNLGLHVRKEWNHNGNVGKVERYRANVNISPVWRMPFRIAGAHLSFEGFADYNTAKGKDGAGHDTKPEFITRPQLKLDLGPVVRRQGSAWPSLASDSSTGTTPSARTPTRCPVRSSSRPSSR